MQTEINFEESLPLKEKDIRFNQPKSKRRNNSSKYTIQYMQTLAESQGGKCLTVKHVNGRRILNLQCKEGHLWSIRYDAFIRGSWCRKCYIESQKLTIGHMHELAEAKGGKCLSTNYVNAHTKLKWKCKEGHQWETSPNKIKRGSWCPSCGRKSSNDKRRGSLKELHKLAESRGGKFLSTEYINVDTKHEWICKQGHVWSARPSSIKRGTWCPTCSGFIYRGETIVRQVFQFIFQKPFPNVRLDILNGRQLDGYNKEIMVAFEHHGTQHYEPTTYGKRSKKEAKITLKKIQRRDKNLQDMCKSKGIKLIVIRKVGFKTGISIRDVPSYILKECIVLGLPIKRKDLENLNINPYNLDFWEENFDRIKDIVISKRGIILSKEYKGSNIKIKIQCENNHVFHISPSKIKTNRWCRSCGIEKRASLRRLTIESMYELAKSHEGECLSDKYVNANSKLIWRCKKGHIFEMTPNKVKSQRNWCPDCGGTKKLTIEKVHKLAKVRGFKCLSDRYVNANSKLRWKCKKGHTLRVSQSYIKNGGGCAECSGKKKLTIEKMKAIAKERGGKCLSTVYVNSKTNLQWQCKEGHQWESPPDRIKGSEKIKGKWCSECSGNKKLTIEKMKAIAKERGGKCLSTVYVNSKTNLQWQCKEGH
ncbi:hypothetical protein AB834_02920, partial [PVC group bacterium (ex Bugula neritina AB1)]